MSTFSTPAHHEMNGFRHKKNRIFSRFHFLFLRKKKKKKNHIKIDNGVCLQVATP